MTKKKILLAQNSAFIANRLPRAARALQEAGYEVDILNWNRGVNADVIEEATEAFAKEGITVHSIYCGHTPYGKGIMTIVNKLRFLLNVVKFLFKHGQQYDVVHAIDFDLGYPVYLAKALRPRLQFKMIYDIADFVETFHSPIPSSVRKIIKGLSERIMGATDRVIIPDDNRLINIPKMYQSKTSVVNNSIDPPKLTVEMKVDVSMERYNIFYYGALSTDRGIEQLLAQQNVEIWFAGKGEMQQEIEQQAASQAHIHYLGYLKLEEILSIAAQMDLIYMVYDPSFQHNQIASPNKLYEALYLGKPCVVAKNTSIDVFVEKHHIGYVTAYDTQSLAATLATIERDELEQMGHNAHEIYPQYSWEHAKKKLVQIYKTVTE